MIAMLYPGFNKFIPDSSPLTEILSIQARHALNNNMIVYFISLLEFYFTLFKMKHFLKNIKKYLSSPGVYNFLKIQIIQSLAHFNVTGCLLWFTGCSRSLQRFVNGIQETIVNTLRPRRSRRHFADDSFRYISLNENIWILIKISLKFIAQLITFQHWFR